MSRQVASAVDRRQFLTCSVAGAVVATLPGRALAAGSDTLRVGLVGCGGRGTGAAAQALAADPGARLVAMGDLFADQIASSHGRLARLHESQVDCPRGRCFVGAEACHDVLAAGLDLVILAAPPSELASHLVSAVAAGVHVHCEAPVAVDVAGVHEAAAAVEAARLAGLSIGSGLCDRHDAAARTVIDAIHAGRIGIPREVHVEARIGLPWRRPTSGSRDHADAMERNWIAFPARSGGPFVEHHVHAIDRALWALGDALPESVVARRIAGGRNVGTLGGGHAGVAARFTFTDGRTIDALCHRRAGAADRIVETVTGSGGTLDLRAALAASRHDRFQAAMTRLVGGIRDGRRTDEGERLCRATLVAVMGRMAAETGRRIDRGMVAAPRIA
jgi:myo-inositol 2-dehydrogenase/D-chiro-inositol 1-dehydrogenase